MKFADFTEGMVATTPATVLTQQSIIDFAKQHDPQWFHVDVQACDRGPYGGLIASGWQTACVAMRQAVDHYLAGSESFGSPGLAYLKWLAPVRPDDALRLRVTVLEKRLSSKNPALGVMRWRWEVLNQSDSCVLDLEATSLFDLKPS